MAYLFSFLPFAESVKPEEKYSLSISQILQREKGWGASYLMLIGYFLLILAVVLWL